MEINLHTYENRLPYVCNEIYCYTGVWINGIILWSVECLSLSIKHFFYFPKRSNIAIYSLRCFYPTNRRWIRGGFNPNTTAYLH
jgi:hypothetical protein